MLHNFFSADFHKNHSRRLVDCYTITFLYFIPQRRPFGEWKLKIFFKYDKMNTCWEYLDFILFPPVRAHNVFLLSALSNITHLFTLGFKEMKAYARNIQ